MPILATLTLHAASVSEPTSAGPSAEMCVPAIRQAVRDKGQNVVPGACWHIGPIVLGMAEPEVERRLGAPAQRLVTGGVTTTLHVFPARPGLSVRRGRARFRLAELRYVSGRLAAVDDSPGTVTTVSPHRCDGKALADRVVQDAITGPLLNFDGVGIGDPARRIGARFGAQPSWNRSRDWYNYLPVPVSFDVDPERERIVGLAIARDEDLLTAARPSVQMILRADPNGCTLTGIDFGLTP